MDRMETERASCWDLEQQARAAAEASNSDADRDDHVMRAERYADRAWSIEEDSDLDYRPSGLWSV